MVRKLILVAVLVLTLVGCGTIENSAAKTPSVPLPDNLQGSTVSSEDGSAPITLNVMEYEATIERKSEKSVIIHYPSVVYPGDIITFASYMMEKYPSYFEGSSLVLMGDNTAYLELDFPFTDEEVRQYLPTLSSEIDAFVPVYLASLEEVGAPVRLSEKAIAEAAAQQAEAEKAESTTEIPAAVSTVNTETPSVTVSEPVPAPEPVQVPLTTVQSAPVSEKAVEITAVAEAEAKAARTGAGPIILIAVIVILAASCICYYLVTKKKKN